MTTPEMQISHLQTLQKVIYRLSNDSFLMKCWSVFLFMLAMIMTFEHPAVILLPFLVFILGFWVLDGYFLWQERLFRAIHKEATDKLVAEKPLDLKINPMKHADAITWHNSMLSCTLNIFYGMQFVALFLVFGLLL